MRTDDLIVQIRAKRSLLCVGLDTDPTLLPECLKGEDDPIYAFNKAIVDATAAHAVALKPNLAFYEAMGADGWRSLERTMGYVNERYPELFTIADAKRGDIGNTADRYAQAFFRDMGFDAVTVAPYMGRDSVEPFLAHEDKHTILLGLTSNAGASDFQEKPLGGVPLYEAVMRQSIAYRGSERLMFVVGATRADRFQHIREIVGGRFLLVPGVGAQGGDLDTVMRDGSTPQGGLLINSSRQIIYASGGVDYAGAAERQSRRLVERMRPELAV